MIDRHHQNSPATQVDLKRLAIHFKTPTNWHVITGAPCCGKTTLVNQLAAKGFQTVPEVGRDYIEREIARGRTIEEVRASDAVVSRAVDPDRWIICFPAWRGGEL